MANFMTRRRLTNRLMIGLSGVAALIGMTLLALILGYTLIHGLSYINLDFLTNAYKPVGEAGGGMRNEIIGTLILVGLGSLIAIPIGLMTGLFLADFGSPRMASAFRFVADVLSGVPSIVVGVFAFAIVVKPMHSYSAFSGGIALAIIMIPIIARTAEEALRLVPISQREAALALGITRWRSVLGVVIPGAMTGIITGIMLGVARIAGETAPLLFTALGNNFGFNGLLKPIGALPLQIYHFALSPFKDQQQQAWAGAFLLIVLVLVVSIIVRWLSRGKKY
ncbi:phosphate transport system permease protein [Dehalogenimonas formicexedens]|uniref:Phosphate transport system permease protein PstA n=1 Tax=Dehalogenimonas formicexedens TaxID=1839801 RepID=A0A1P8F8Z5_9CHLR|nr:phosphate ABC transporter permease PstA [Dehalogenimonas formicexedens]APV44937.1 phosphate transport system permease protein [Dehalogenimonas formicexedens]